MANIPYIGRPLREPSGGLDLIKTIDSGSSATYEFLHGTNDVVLDGTYRSYVFEFINMHPLTATGVIFRWKWSKDGGNSYSTMTASTGAVSSRHDEDGSPAATAKHDTGYYSGTGTNAWASGKNHNLGGYCLDDSDSSTSGYLHWFANYSTNKIPIAQIKSSTSASGPACIILHLSNGIDEQNEVINGVQFYFSSGNIDTGTIKLYGFRR